MAPPKEHIHAIHIKPSKGKEAHMTHAKGPLYGKMNEMSRTVCSVWAVMCDTKHWWVYPWSSGKKHAQSCRKPICPSENCSAKVPCTSDPELSMHHKSRICIACDWILVLLHSPDASIASSYRLLGPAAFELLHLDTSISHNLLIFFSLLSLSWHTSNRSSCFWTNY